MDQKLSSTLRRLRNIKNQLQSVTEPDTKEPLRVLITGAGGQIAYSLVFMVCQGRMFGPNQEVIVHLFDLPQVEQGLKGVAMEINDGAFELVKGIVVTVDPVVAFKDIDVGLFVGGKPRGPGMERKDLLTGNAKIFVEQGKYLNQYAKKTCKSVVIANPANTNALILAKNCPTIPVENFSALTRLDHNRMVSQLAEKMKVDVKNIKNCILWGNHSSTQYPDVDCSYVQTCQHKYPTRSLVNDDKWLHGEFISTVQKRGAAVIAARKLSSAASAANATCDHMRNWFHGTPQGEWTSMGVISKGEYGSPIEVMFSFPVTCENGNWKIVEGLKLTEFSKEKIALTSKELMEEKTTIFPQK